MGPPRRSEPERWPENAESSVLKDTKHPPGRARREPWSEVEPSGMTLGGHAGGLKEHRPGFPAICRLAKWPRPDGVDCPGGSVSPTVPDLPAGGAVDSAAA